MYYMPVNKAVNNIVQKNVGKNIKNCLQIVA